MKCSGITLARSCFIHCFRSTRLLWLDGSGPGTNRVADGNQHHARNLCRRRRFDQATPAELRPLLQHTDGPQRRNNTGRRARRIIALW